MFGIWTYIDELQIKFKFCSAWVIFAEIVAFGNWQFCENISFPHFFFKRLSQMIWCLVFGLILMSYRSSLSFVPLEWFLRKLWPLEIGNFVKMSVFRTFFLNASAKWLNMWYVDIYRWVTDQVKVSFHLSEICGNYGLWK